MKYPIQSTVSFLCWEMIGVELKRDLMSGMVFSNFGAIVGEME